MAVSAKSSNNKRKLDKSNGSKAAASNKIKFDDDESEATPKSSNKRIVFDDDGQAATEVKPKAGKKTANNAQQAGIGSKWYQEYAKFNTSEELLDMKDAETIELTNFCKNCFDAELAGFQKRNPSDVKWLKTALHKGTSRDRANAGALLVQTNPIANLEELETLIGLTKNANKASTDSVDIVTELFINALLPPDRKLLSIPMRGADWKALRKNDNTDKSTMNKVYALWHFEAVLKEQYFEFLRNLQSAIQGSQDTNKNQAIIYSSKLLCYAPEKEQMLLAMLVNKLGDPSNKVAAKALHYLTEVSYKHPAMCGVITNETEKFLFRNNITDHAQHFALTFLAQLAPNGNIDVCTKLVQICFSFFKILVSKGSINSRTMQAILRCLKRAITDVITAGGAGPGSDADILNKDTQDTIYRLVHHADMPTSLQTLALLLQVISVLKTHDGHDRFYNVLYKKLLDPNLGTCGTKAAALFLHVVHKAIHIDANRSRAQAFVKRLLQVSLYFPSQMLCGSLIVVNKIIKARPDLNKFTVVVKQDMPNGEADNELDAPEEEAEHGDSPEVTAANGESRKDKATHNQKVSAIAQPKYNAYHRVPAFAGAQFTLQTELVALLYHYHPTVRVFAQNLIDNIHIKFYGDPLRDFSLSQFLERFAFKNPKKAADKKHDSLVQAIHNTQYKAAGSRGQSVRQLTDANCTEDERFIFEYLNKKREIKAAFADAEENDEVDDDEFDAYLDSLAGKVSKKATKHDDESLDFMGDLDGDAAKTSRSAELDDDENDWDDDEPGDSDGSEDAGEDLEDDEFDGSDDGSISLDDEDLFEESDVDDSDGSGDDSDGGPKAKKHKPLSSKEFNRKLKHSDDMSSLFAAADDFSEMLEETGKSRKHGTLGEIFNQDKSSERQMDWEQKRMKQRDFRPKRPRPAANKKPQKRNRSQGQRHRGEKLVAGVKKRTK